MVTGCCPIRVTSCHARIRNTKISRNVPPGRIGGHPLSRPLKSIRGGGRMQETMVLLIIDAQNAEKMRNCTLTRHIPKNERS